MPNFGFTISKPRTMDYDHLDRTRAEELLRRVPSYRACIGCGGCAATCSAGQLTDFNIRRIHTQFKRGDYAGLEEKLRACMLCGKCTLVCPRGINTRGLIVEMRKLLADSAYVDRAGAAN